MGDPKKEYRKKRAEACAKAFAGFSPNLQNCRNPEEVLLVAELAKKGYYSNEIAEVIGKSPKAVQKIFRRYSFPCLHNILPPKLDERHDWKHGQKMMKGYIYQRAPGHPNGTKHGCYVALHRLVMEKKLGRYLLPTEVVDHIDGDITNNHPNNLRVFSSNSEHLRKTLKGRVPGWSEEGKKRISDAVRLRHQKARDRKASSSRSE